MKKKILFAAIHVMIQMNQMIFIMILLKIDVLNELFSARQIYNYYNYVLFIKI